MAAFVLIVEDDATQRDSLCRLIEGGGYEAESVESADAAFEILDARGADLVALVTDVAMDGCTDGIDLAVDIRERWPGVAIIVVSGEDAPQRTDFPKGATFLRKPWRNEDLLDALFKLK